MANLSDMPQWLVKLVKQTKDEVAMLRAAESVRGHSRLADFKEAFSAYAVLAYRSDPKLCLERTEAFLAESKVAFLENISASELLRVYVRGLLPKQVNVSISYAKPGEGKLAVRVDATEVVQAPFVVIPKAKVPAAPAPRAIAVASVAAVLIWDGDRFAPYDESEVMDYYAGRGFSDVWRRSCAPHFRECLPLVHGIVDDATACTVGWHKRNGLEVVHINSLPATYRALHLNALGAHPSLIVASLRPGEVELTSHLADLLFVDPPASDATDVYAQYSPHVGERLWDCLPRLNTPEAMLKLRMMLWVCDPPVRAWYRVPGYTVRSIDSCSVACVPLRPGQGSGSLLAYATATPRNDAYRYLTPVPHGEPGAFQMEARGLHFAFADGDCGLGALVRAAHCMADDISFGTENDVDELIGALSGAETVYQQQRAHTDYREWGLDSPFATDPLCPTNVVWRAGGTVLKEREEPLEHGIKESVVWQMLPCLDDTVHEPYGPVDGVFLRQLAYQLHLQSRGTSLHLLATSRDRSQLSEQACFEADFRAYLRLGASDVKFTPFAESPPLTNVCGVGCGHFVADQWRERDMCLHYRHLDLDLMPITLGEAGMLSDDEDGQVSVGDQDGDSAVASRLAFDDYFASLENAVRLDGVLEAIEALRRRGPYMSGDLSTSAVNLVAPLDVDGFRARLDSLEINTNYLLLHNEPAVMPGGSEPRASDDAEGGGDSVPESERVAVSEPSAGALSEDVSLPELD